MVHNREMCIALFQHPLITALNRTFLKNIWVFSLTLKAALVIVNVRFCGSAFHRHGLPRSQWMPQGTQ